MKQTKKTVYLLTQSAAVAALTALGASLLHVHVADGHVHLGDVFLYLGASILPPGYAFFAAGIAGVLCDLLYHPHLALWSFFIKGSMSLMFTSRKKELLCRTNLLAPLFAGIISMAGYYLAHAILLGNFTAALFSLAGNGLQAFLSTVLYAGAALLLDKVHFKEFI